MVLNCYLCKRCGEPILLPLETLQQTFEFQDHPSKDTYPVAVACTHCMTVESYTEADLAGFEEVSNHSHNWDVPEPWLKCAEAVCREEMPLFVDWSAPSAAGTKLSLLRGLKWGNPQCRFGHETAKRMW
jgi:hypothetical protein